MVYYFLWNPDLKKCAFYSVHAWWLTSAKDAKDHKDSPQRFQPWYQVALYRQGTESLQELYKMCDWKYNKMKKF
jgi:hypothetical protein